MKRLSSIFPGTFIGSVMVCVLFVSLPVLRCFSQDISASIQQSVENYKRSNYQEKVFLHTDKTVFATGEILWFKAYVTDAATNKFSPLSKICYVEIISNDHRPLLQGKIGIDSGRGNGSFTIPPSIASGNYLLRAYTNWMKNFDPGLYYEQQVSIINPGKKPEILKKDSVNYNLNFFPEGGNLVYGLSNTVAFKISDYNGNAVSGKGVILDGQGDTVLNFATAEHGMGRFDFVPVKANKYHALVTIDGTSQDYALPKIFSNGWTLHVEEIGEVIRVKVRCNVEEQQQVYLIAQTKDSLTFAKMQLLKADSTTFIINKSSIGEGVSRITMFNQNRQPVCERLYFKKSAALPLLKVVHEEQDFQQRKKVDMQVLMNDSNGSSLKADLSVSVYLVDSLQPDIPGNIATYLQLTSELNGPVESPQYYFSNAAGVAEAADNLMLTQGWRRFNWKEVLSNTKASFTFLPEHEGHIITGKITALDPNAGDSAVRLYLSVPGSNFTFANSTSSNDGTIRFNVDEFYGRHDIVIQPDAVDSNYRISIDNPFSVKFSNSIVQPINLMPTLASEMATRMIAVQSRNVFRPASHDRYILPVSYDTMPFFGYPSKAYNLDDYTRFPAMEEVMREYVKEVRVRNRQKQFYYEVYNEATKLFFDEAPLVLLDGVPVFNLNKIMAFDPLKVKRIDVAATRVFRGNQEYEGVVSYTTYSDELEGYELDPGSLVVDYEGLQFEREFYAPQYETAAQQASRIPDYRNVLYWSPDVKVNNGKAGFSFYTSDIPGKYKIVIQGLSNTGRPAVGYSEIYVR